MKYIASKVNDVRMSKVSPGVGRNVFAGIDRLRLTIFYPSSIQAFKVSSEKRCLAAVTVHATNQHERKPPNNTSGKAMSQDRKDWLLVTHTRLEVLVAPVVPTLNRVLGILEELVGNRPAIVKAQYEERRPLSICVSGVRHGF